CLATTARPYAGSGRRARRFHRRRCETPPRRLARGAQLAPPGAEYRSHRKRAVMRPLYRSYGSQFDGLEFTPLVGLRDALLPRVFESRERVEQALVQRLAVCGIFDHALFDVVHADAL